MDREIKALEFTNERRQGSGPAVDFMEETYIERILEKRRPEDSSGNSVGTNSFVIFESTSKS